MNTPEHDDWERLFRQRLSDFEAQPPTDALARILAIANPSPVPVTTNPVSAARTLGAGGIVAVLLGIWLMQATQRPHNSLAESVQISINRKTPLSMGHRPSGYAPLAKSKQEPETLTLGSAERQVTKGPVARTQPQRKASTEDVLSMGRRPSGYSSLGGAKRERLLTDAPLTLGSAERRINKGPVAQTQPQFETSRENMPTGHRPSGYASLAEGEREPISSTGAVYPATSKFTAPDLSQRLVIDLIEIQRTAQPYQKLVLMAETTPKAAPAAPAIARQRPARDWFVDVTPLYTYQQIAPVHTDERYVEQVQTLGAFSGGRAGWRAQIGVEQAINKQFAIRAGLTISELRQSVQYRSRGASFDSAKIEVLDNQTIRLTPLYRHQTGQLPAVRRFVGISADIIWRPNAAQPFAASAGPNQRWQPYLTAGLSAGKYAGSGGELSGFWQASAGVERAIWPGWWLRAGPSVQYGWHALTDSPVLTTRPYTYGLTIGLRH